jgi:hypothetical protein
MSRVAIGFTVFAIIAGATAAAQLRTGAEVAAGQTIVLAELFTSEGCSSCPPADRLLETLLKQQPASGVYVVPLSEHVDYWDHQGWKDPFGSPQFTERQKVYGFRFNVDSIYTPQLVIDGTNEFVGSDERELKRVLAKAVSKPKPELHVEFGTAPDKPGTVVGVSGRGLAAEGEAAEVMVAVTEDDLVVDVRRGENASRTLHHSGVVRVLTSAGTIEPATKAPPTMFTTVVLKPEWRRDKLRVVAFVQAKKSRRVLSVGWRAVG